MTEQNNSTLPGWPAGNEDQVNLPGYPLYPASEDIYAKSKEEQEINPEDTSRKKNRNDDDKNGKENEKDFDEDESGDDLDIPGSELDDEDEEIGSEDEENNYYSIGGDNHNDLEDDSGE
jgi:hypothetical protein